MPPYRIKIFDRFGVDRAGITLSFEDDEEAIRLVAEHSMGHRMEMWEGDRLVKLFEVGEEASFSWSDDPDDPA